MNVKISKPIDLYRWVIGIAVGMLILLGGLCFGEVSYKPYPATPAALTAATNTTMIQAAARFVDVAGDTMTGALDISNDLFAIFARVRTVHVERVVAQYVIATNLFAINVTNINLYSTNAYIDGHAIIVGNANIAGLVTISNNINMTLGVISNMLAATVNGEAVEFLQFVTATNGVIVDAQLRIVAATNATIADAQGRIATATNSLWTNAEGQFVDAAGDTMSGSLTFATNIENKIVMLAWQEDPSGSITTQALVTTTNGYTMAAGLSWTNLTTTLTNSLAGLWLNSGTYITKTVSAQPYFGFKSSNNFYHIVAGNLPDETLVNCASNTTITTKSGTYIGAGQFYGTAALTINTTTNTPFLVSTNSTYTVITNIIHSTSNEFYYVFDGVKHTLEDWQVTTNAAVADAAGRDIAATNAVTQALLPLIANQNGLEYYLIGGTQDPNSSNTYYSMSKTPGGAATATQQVANVTNNQYVVQYITPTNEPGLTVLKSGIYNVQFHARKTAAGGTVSLKAELYIYHNDAVITQEIEDTETTTPLTTTLTSYDVVVPVATDYTIAADDRIVIKLKAVAVTTTPTIQIMTEGTTVAHISIPISAGTYALGTELIAATNAAIINAAARDVVMSNAVIVDAAARDIASTNAAIVDAAARDIISTNLAVVNAAARDIVISNAVIVDAAARDTAATNAAIINTAARDIAATNAAIINAAARDVVMSNAVIVDAAARDTAMSNATYTAGIAYTDGATGGCLQVSDEIPVAGAVGFFWSPDTSGTNSYITLDAMLTNDVFTTALTNRLHVMGVF